MQIAFRAIFALLVLIQALPGLAVAPCVRGPAMDERAVAAASACPCCVSRDDPACGSVESVVCCCGRPAPADPATPANDAGGKKLDPIPVGPAPSWSWAPLPFPVVRVLPGDARRDPGLASRPVQAVLCVWVV